jgi:hypothetical protein
MHQAKMKRQRFIYSKVMARLVVARVDKTSWIPHTDVFPLTFEGDDGDNFVVGAEPITSQCYIQDL